MRQYCPICGDQDTSVVWSPVDKSQYENKNSKMKSKTLIFEIYWECNDCSYTWKKGGVESK